MWTADMPERKLSLYGVQLERIAAEFHTRVGQGATEVDARDAIDPHVRAEAAAGPLGFSQAAMAVMASENAAALAAMLTREHARDQRVEPLLAACVDVLRTYTDQLRRQNDLEAQRLELERLALAQAGAQRLTLIETIKEVGGSRWFQMLLAAAASALTTGSLWKGCGAPP